MTTQPQLNPNEIKDSLGRIIKLKEITGKIRIAFYRALGAKDAANIAVIGEYWSVLAVESIDGQSMPLKTLVDIEYTYDQIEKGNAFTLIDEWLRKNEEEKLAIEKEAKDLKKS